jgi:hypothetical protein
MDEIKITAVLRIRETYQGDEDLALRLLAQFSLDEFKHGGRPDETNRNNRLGYANSDVSHHYVRAQIGQAYGQALEYVQQFYPNDIAELIKVEWDGQNRVPVEQPILDDEGNPTGEMETVYVEQLFQTGTQDILDEQEQVIATVPVYLGRIGG